jgi:hypothetical protein
MIFTLGPMTSHAPGHYEVVKPSGTAWKAGPLLLAGLFAVAIAVNFDSDDLGLTVMLAVAAVLIIGVLTVVLLRSRLEIGPGVVVRRGVTGTKRVTGDAVDRVVWIAALQAGQTGRVRSRLIAVGHSGDAALRLTTAVWPRETLVKVAQTLSTTARLVSIDQPVTVAMVKQFEPAALSWGERNPGKLVALSVLGTFAALAALFGIFVLTG